MSAWENRRLNVSMLSIYTHTQLIYTVTVDIFLHMEIHLIAASC